MMANKKLLVITASNGENLKLANRFVASAKRLGAVPTLIDLTTLALPIYNPRLPANNEIASEISSLHSQMISIERWVICAPEYNGSIPPLLTNAIAWLSVQESDFRKLFNGRPIAIASHSGGGGMEVLISLRIQLTHLGAQVVGRQLSSNQQNPAKDESIIDLTNRLMQMNPLLITN